MKPILTEEEEKLLADVSLSWDRFKHKGIIERICKKYENDSYIKKSLINPCDCITYYIKDLEDVLFKKIPEWLKQKKEGIKMSCIFCNHIWIDKNDGLYTTCPECGSKYCDG